MPVPHEYMREKAVWACTQAECSLPPHMINCLRSAHRTDYSIRSQSVRISATHVQIVKECSRSGARFILPYKCLAIFQSPISASASLLAGIAEVEERPAPSELVLTRFRFLPIFSQAEPRHDVHRSRLELARESSKRAAYARRKCIIRSYRICVRDPIQMTKRKADVGESCTQACMMSSKRT